MIATAVVFSHTISWFGDQDQCIVYSPNTTVHNRYDPLMINAEAPVAQGFSTLTNTNQSDQDQSGRLLVRVESGEPLPGR